VGRSFGPPRVTCRRAGGAQVGRSVGRFRLKNSLRCTRQTVGRTAPTQIFRRAAHGQWVGRSGQIPIVPVSCGAPPTRSPLSHAPLSSHRVTARRRCAMPVGRSDGCLSTTRCHGMCVQKPVTFSSPSGCTFTQCSLPGPYQKALRVTGYSLHGGGVRCPRWSIRRLSEHHTVSCEV
jgi:hypothetical protein